MAVDVVHELDEFGMLQPVVAEELAHMGPVLLLDMGVVVFAIGPAAGEGHAPRVQVAMQGPVEELAAVVAVEAFHREGQRPFRVGELGQNPGCALVPDRAVFRPAAAGSVTVRLWMKSPAVVSPQWATVSASRCPGSLVLAGRPAAPPGGAKAIPAWSCPGPQRGWRIRAGGQQPVDRRRAQVQQLPTHRGRKPLFEMRQPRRDDLLEPLAARCSLASQIVRNGPKSFFAS